MKTAIFAIAMLLGGAAFAQIDVTAESTAWEGDGTVTTAFETEGASGGGTYAAALPASADASVVQPSNADPELDARGIPVISAAAVVPPGWNGIAAGAAMGGPELDAVTGETVAPDSYPACTADVTDKCLQTYEVGRH